MLEKYFWWWLEKGINCDEFKRYASISNILKANHSCATNSSSYTLNESNIFVPSVSPYSKFSKRPPRCSLVDLNIGTVLGVDPSCPAV